MNIDSILAGEATSPSLNNTEKNWKHWTWPWRITYWISSFTDTSTDSLLVKHDVIGNSHGKLGHFTSIQFRWNEVGRDEVRWGKVLWYEQSTRAVKM